MNTATNTVPDTGTAVLRPPDAGYDEARAAWNLDAHQRPAAVVLARSAADVLAGVRLARKEGRGVAVMATGHGTAAPCDDGVLVNTSRMSGVRVDALARRARAEAGARWADLIPRAAAHGLAGLPGSSSGVGIVGYTTGGGFGWLARRYGLASDHVVRAQLVTAEAELVTVSAERNTDLFWGVRGGVGNFGIVTSLEFSLHPVTTVYAGNLYYPASRARELLSCYAEWSRGLPDAMTSAAAFRTFPPLPAIPEPLRGNAFVAVRGCYCGDDLAEGEQLVEAVRHALGQPVADTFARMPVAALDAVGMDPVDPLGAHQHTEMLRELSPATIETLVALGTDSPLAVLEVRQLGGALTRPASVLSPMGRSDARFTLNAIGVTPTPHAATAVRSHLAHLAESIRPHTTGTTYVNFLDLDRATPDRVRAAYSKAEWERLVALKTEHDPDNLFRFNRNIPPFGGTR